MPMSPPLTTPSASGVARIVECAPGKVLAGLVKRTVDGVEAVAITDSAALAAALTNA